jgi:hypothetical protein
MLNDKWIGEGIVRLLGRDGRALVQGAVNQDVGTAGILPRISEKCRMQNEHSAPRRNQKGLASWLAQSRGERRGKQTQWRPAFHRKQRRTICREEAHKAHNQKTLCAFFAFSRLFKCVQSCGPLGKLAGFLSRPADN